MTDFPESPVVMFTNYKRHDGFEVSLTLRGDSLKTVATDLDTAITAIIAKGGTPVTRQKTGFAPKQVEYVENRACPTCGEKLVHAQKKDGTKFIKCSTNKWVGGQSVGCSYVDWMNNNGAPRVNAPVIPPGEEPDFSY